MPPKPTTPGRLIGYARVSTEEQGTDPQRDELRASGADRRRPVLAQLLREIRPGETLVVVRLDNEADNYFRLFRQPGSNVQTNPVKPTCGKRRMQLLSGLL